MDAPFVLRRQVHETYRTGGFGLICIINLERSTQDFGIQLTKNGVNYVAYAPACNANAQS